MPDKVMHSDLGDTLIVEIGVLEDESNNGGYYTDCPVCDWSSPRYNFKGSARLRVFEHFSDEIKKEKEK